MQQGRSQQAGEPGARCPCSLPSRWFVAAWLCWVVYLLVCYSAAGCTHPVLAQALPPRHDRERANAPRPRWRPAPDTPLPHSTWRQSRQAEMTKPTTAMLVSGRRAVPSRRGGGGGKVVPPGGGARPAGARLPLPRRGAKERGPGGRVRAAGSLAGAWGGGRRGHGPPPRGPPWGCPGAPGATAPAGGAGPRCLVRRHGGGARLGGGRGGGRAL